MIPKIIHYCWFGKRPIPKMLKHCIATWKKLLPDYEIILWNECNSELDCEFVRQAYKQKKWAFVSDYVRLKAIYEFGGVYLDTDMLLVKSLDDFLENDCFLVAEHNTSIGLGIFGGVKNHEFINSCLNFYRSLRDTNKNFVPIPKTVFDVFTQRYYFLNKIEENIKCHDLIIYTHDYFYPLPYTDLQEIHNYKRYLKDTTYGVHLWFGSWHNYNEFVLIRRKEYSKSIKKIFRTIFIQKKANFLYFRKILTTFKESIETKDAFR